jgi:hypothetical protein
MPGKPEKPHLKPLDREIQTGGFLPKIGTFRANNVGGRAVFRRQFVEPSYFHA